jgi:Flp pilus assembly protein TadG
MSETIRTSLQQERNGEHSEHSQRGQSPVEMAVVVPILLILLAAIIDTGRAFDAYIVLTNASREGARFASLANPISEPEIKKLVYDDVIGSGTNISSLANFTTTNVAILAPDDSEAVTVTVTYTLDLWFGGLVGLNTFPLGHTAIMPRAEF